jgi:hypothetical protein
MPTQARWGIVPFIISLGLFFTALALSFHATYVSLRVASMTNVVNPPWAIDVFWWLAIASFVFGLAVLLFGGMLTLYFLRTQNKEDSAQVAERNIIKKLNEIKDKMPELPKVVLNIGDINKAIREELRRLASQ